jgi:hypothetical protein
MDPTHWQVYTSIAKDVVTAGAAITAAVVAVKGLRAWKKQLRGKTDYELARRCLRAVYRVRDAIRMVRNPMQSSEEIAHAVKEEGPSIPQHLSDDYKIQQAVYNFRLKSANDAFSELQVELLEAQVSWGGEAVAAIEPLQNCALRLRSAIRRHLRRLLRDGQMTPARAEELEIILYVDDDLQDPFSDDIREAVEKAEKFLQRHLKI